MTAATAPIHVVFRRAHAAGLNMTQAVVLSHLVHHFEESIRELGVGDATTIQSRQEIAKATALNYSAVQRALQDLAKMGFIIRQQRVKRSGETAVTMITAAAVRLFAPEHADLFGPCVPVEISSLLIGQPLEVIRAIAQAWSDCAFLPDTLDETHSLSTRDFEIVRFLLSERAIAHQGELLAAIEAKDAAATEDRTGEYKLRLPDGDTVVLSKPQFQRASGDAKANLIDMRFVRDTLECLMVRAPGMVTRRTLPKLIADIGFSRAFGFVFARDYSPAMRILASVIQRPNWSTPHKMPAQWYAGGTAAVC